MSKKTLPTELWDVQRLADYLGKTPRFVYRLTSEKRIRFINLGRDLRFDPADVQEYLDRQRAGLDVRPDPTPPRGRRAA